MPLAISWLLGVERSSTAPRKHKVLDACADAYAVMFQHMQGKVMTVLHALAVRSDISALSRKFHFWRISGMSGFLESLVAFSKVVKYQKERVFIQR